MKPNQKILLLALFFHIAASWFSIGRYHADEQYQILEFADYKTGNNSAASLPWEFHEKIRPALQPGIAYAIISSAHAIGIQNPFTIAFLLRLMGSAFGFIVALKLIQLYK